MRARYNSRTSASLAAFRDAQLFPVLLCHRRLNCLFVRLVGPSDCWLFPEIWTRDQQRDIRQMAGYIAGAPIRPDGKDEHLIGLSQNAPKQLKTGRLINILLDPGFQAEKALHTTQASSRANVHLRSAPGDCAREKLMRLPGLTVCPGRTPVNATRPFGRGKVYRDARSSGTEIPNRTTIKHPIWLFAQLDLPALGSPYHRFHSVPPHRPIGSLRRGRIRCMDRVPPERCS